MSQTKGKAAELYDRFYYATGCGTPYENADDFRQLFRGFADRIVSDIGPANVLDAGCATGYLVEELRERGVEAFGVDISDYAIAHANAGAAPYCRVGSVADPFPRAYDLIVCIEVLEHLPKDEAEATVANLCRHANDILFSSSPHDFKEVTHFNARPTDYWVEQFARHGFYPDADFDGTFLTRWTLRFRKGHEPVPRAFAAYERRRYWLEQEIEGIRAAALELRRDLGAKDDELRIKEREVAELAALEAREEAVLAQKAEAERRAAEAERRAAEAERRAAEAERRAAEILSSISWRVTAPVRAVLKRIRGQ